MKCSWESNHMGKTFKPGRDRDVNLTCSWVMKVNSNFRLWLTIDFHNSLNFLASIDKMWKLHVIHTQGSWKTDLRCLMVHNLCNVWGYFSSRWISWILKVHNGKFCIVGALFQIKIHSTFKPQKKKIPLPAHITNHSCGIVACFFVWKVESL